MNRALPFAASVLLCLAAASATHQSVPVQDSEPTVLTSEPATAVFEALKSLVGTWEGLAASGRTSRVAYRISAGDSVLVETWTQSRGREALTLYHLDGAQLLATHYCPKGNTTRLRWQHGSLAEGLGFEFVDGTNLEVEGQSHQRSFQIKLLDEGAFERGETYVLNGSSAEEAAAQPTGAMITYRRT